MKQQGIKLVFVSLCLALAALLILPLGCPAPTPTTTPPPTTTAPPTTAPTTTPPAEPLKIGMLLPYTGFASPWTAPYMESAAKLALDNVGWEVAGRPIEVIVEDEASDAVVAVEKAKKLVEHDQVDVLLGCLWGASVVAVSGYVNGTDICYAPFVQQSILTITEAPNNAVLPTGTLAGSTYAAGLYAYDVLGYRTATVAYQDFVAGWDFIGGFEAGFTERGGTIVQRQAIAPGTIDFAPYLTNLDDADCLAYWLAGTMNIFLDQYYQFKVQIPVIPLSYWCLEMDPLGELGDTPLGIVSSGHANEWVTDLPLNAAFVEAMYNRGYAPVHYAYSANMVTSTFLEAVKATGGDTSPEKLIPAWRNVSIDTPMGPISFDEEGCGIGNYYVYEYSKEGGEYYWKTLKEYAQIPMRCTAIDG